MAIKRMFLVGLVYLLYIIFFMNEYCLDTLYTRFFVILLKFRKTFLVIMLFILPSVL